MSGRKNTSSTRNYLVKCLCPTAQKTLNIVSPESRKALNSSVRIAVPYSNPRNAPKNMAVAKWSRSISDRLIWQYDLMIGYVF